MAGALGRGGAARPQGILGPPSTPIDLETPEANGLKSI